MTGRRPFPGSGQWAATGRIRQAFLLTTENPTGTVGALGSELNGALFEGRFARITPSAWSPTGKYSAEIIVLAEGTVSFYETFEYFRERASPTGWDNFKGNRAWERRVYIDEGSVVYAEIRGRGAPLLEQPASELLALVARYQAALSAALR